jgi:hypothetical protein
VPYYAMVQIISDISPVARLFVPAICHSIAGCDVLNCLFSALANIPSLVLCGNPILHLAITRASNPPIHREVLNNSKCRSERLKIYNYL